MVASWAVFVTKPSDISPAFSDDGYALPELDVQWHEIATDHAKRAGMDKPRRDTPQRSVRMFADAAEASSTRRGVARLAL